MRILRSCWFALLLIVCSGALVTGEEGGVLLDLKDLCSDAGTGILQFRYSDQVSLHMSSFYPEDFTVGDLVYVLPDQPAFYAFLDQELGTDEGTVYYGRTGLSFDPEAPKILGQLFVVAQTEPSLRFTEPFPEDMRNASNSYLPFRVVVIPKPS